MNYQWWAEQLVQGLVAGVVLGPVLWAVSWIEQAIADWRQERWLASRYDKQRWEPGDRR